MKQLLTIVVTVLSISQILAQDSLSVLFIGNSYTSVNNLPVIISSIAQSMGDEIMYDSQLLGGATFNTHASNSTTYTKINSNPWDYVILQAQSQEPSFPDTQVDTETLPYAEQMADSVFANNFCSEVTMFMTWGRENGDPQWGPISTYEGMQTRLRNAYMRMADSVQGSVSPVGMAWWYVRNNFPTINLYAADGSHPSYEGSYLAACTFYAALFRESPVGSTFYGSLDPVTAGQLQAAAALTVLDSLDQWNLRPIPEHTQADFLFTSNDPEIMFSNQSTKATNYYWDFGDGNTSTDENPSNMYSSNGTYQVTLIAESPCDSDTITYSINVNSAGLDDSTEDEIKVYNYNDGEVILSGFSIPSTIRVYSMSGQLLDEKTEYTQSSLIELHKYGEGVYIITIEGNTSMNELKIPYFPQ